MAYRPLRQKPEPVAAPLLVRARLSHQWLDGAPGPMVVAHHLQKEVQKGSSSVLSGARARVGMVFDRKLADESSEGGWRPIVEPQEVPWRSEYLQALAHGDLWPADEKTAKAVDEYARAQGLPGVKFDPTYSGELKQLTDWIAQFEAPKPAEAPKAPATPTALPVAIAAPAAATSPAAHAATPAAPTKSGEGKA